MQKIKTGIHKRVELRLIDPPSEVDRLEIDELEIRQLAQSIKQQGLLQAIVVAENNGRFEIVAGHRRFLAHQFLKEKTILCRLVPYHPKDNALARASENLQRKDVTPLEEALIYQGLIEKHNLALEEVAAITGVSPGVVRRRINILKMPESLVDAVHKLQISQSVAEELMRCPDASHREYLIEMAREHGVTKDVARSWVDDYLKSLRSSPSASGETSSPPDVYVNQPVYITCGLCGGPVEVQDAKNVTACPGCDQQLNRIREANKS